MTKRFLLQKIKRSIPISNDVIHSNFNKYYLNRYKNQPIIPITQQYSYAYQRKRKPPIFRNFETRFAEDQIGSIDHESARARTCTPVLIPPPLCFRFDIGPRARNSREYQRKLLLARDAQQIRETSRCYAFPFCRIPAFRNFPRSRPPSLPLPLPQLIESNQRFLDPSVHEASRCIPVFTTRTITRKFCTPRNTRRDRIYTVFGVSHSR